MCPNTDVPILPPTSFPLIKLNSDPLRQPCVTEKVLGDPRIYSLLMLVTCVTMTFLLLSTHFSTSLKLTG